MRRKKGCSCINMENGVDAWNRKTRAHASLLDARPAVGSSGALSSEDVVLDDERTRDCGE